MKIENNKMENRPEFFIKEDNMWLHVRSYARKHNLADDCTLKKIDKYDKKMKVLAHIYDNNLCLRGLFKKDIADMKAEGQQFAELDFVA